MAEEHEHAVNGGWPRELDAAPDELTLPEHPTYREMAETFANWRMSDNRWRPAVTKALHWLREAVLGQGRIVDTRLQRIEEALSRRPSPPPGSLRFNPEQTHGGSVRFPPETWQAIQGQLAEQAEAIEKLEREKIEAAAKAAGAAEMAAAIEKRADSRRSRLTAYLAVAATLASGATWLLTHFHVL